MFKLGNDLYPDMDISIEGEFVARESLHIEISYNDDSLYHSGVISAYKNDPLDMVLGSELREQVLMALENMLNEKERTVIRYRFGITDDNSDLTLDEIGQRLRTNREVVRKIETSAFKKLRKLKSQKVLAEYTDNLPCVDDKYINKELLSCTYVKSDDDYNIVYARLFKKITTDLDVSHNLFYLISKYLYTFKEDNIDKILAPTQKELAALERQLRETVFLDSMSRETLIYLLQNILNVKVYEISRVYDKPNKAYKMVVHLENSKHEVYYLYNK